MNGDIFKQKDSAIAEHIAAAKPAYQTPVLSKLGSVGELTRGPGGHVVTDLSGSSV